LSKSDQLFRWLCAALVLVALLPTNTIAKPRIAAASSLQFALKDLLAEFDPAGDRFDTPVYGASGNLFRQIMQGAPYQLFLSADAALPEKLQRAGRARGNPILFGQGRIAFYRNANSPIVIDDQAAGIVTAVRDGQVFRFAIANPRHAPYGLAALDALKTMQLDQLLESRMVYGEKVSQAAMMIRSGAAQIGIVSLSLALSPALANTGEYVVLPAGLHRPVLLQAIAVGDRQADVENFLEFLVSPRAVEILESYGLVQ
jgi:molybdate transport system substrate-binding protein